MSTKQRVLAVDDENDILLILRTALREDYDVLTATSGAEALAKVEDFRPDAIVLDMMMPEMDGLAVLDKLRARPETAGTPVIFLTGVTDKQKIRAALDKGTQYYLTKPFHHTELLTKIAMAIREAADDPLA